jgi:hypothetical protein
MIVSQSDIANRIKNFVALNAVYGGNHPHLASRQKATSAGH